MLSLDLPASARHILCLGAHADDIEIGCGGTLLKWLEERRDLTINWIVFTAEGERADEARRSAEAVLGDAKQTVTVKQFRTSFLPFQGTEIKEFFETIKESFGPDLIFTHCRDDRHQDHRLLSDLTWNTFRNHLILEYEIPKYDGNLGSPNIFVALDETLSRRKTAHICQHFQTQTNKHWFTEDGFLALMRLRGIECCAPYAEAFYCRKLLLA